MSEHLKMCEIPQFKNPMEVRVWMEKKRNVGNGDNLESIKFNLELEHRKLREQNWLKKMKEQVMVDNLTKDILDLELEEYFIPDTPKSCVSYSCCSTRGVSEGNSLFNTTPEDYLYYRDGYISSDSIDNFDNHKLSPALTPINSPYSESITDSDANSLDDWDDLKNSFKDYGKYIS